MNDLQLQMDFTVMPEPSDEPKKTAPKIHTVSQLNQAIRDEIESEFKLVWVKGEISNFKPHTSGHFYFSLKDDKAQISAVMFKGFNAHLKFKPENGLEVLVRGKVTVYPPRGQYQIFCEVMEPVGLGALQLQFEQLKAKLQAEGLFDSKRKRPLPALPQRVALVTSPTGAAIRDMLNVLSRRYRGLEIMLFATAVQGQSAPEEIVSAIELANKIEGFDVMIIGRGGGSMEDLWAFNNEKVARAIAASKIPTVSGVGHEIDFTIADFVADLRAPTPSAAAELIVKNAADLQDKIGKNFATLKLCISKRLQLETQHLKALQKQLVDPKKKLQELQQRCDELFSRLENVVLNILESYKTRINHMGALLDSFSPLKVMERGYSIVKKENKIINTIKKIKEKDTVTILFRDGEATARIENKGEKDV